VADETKRFPPSERKLARLWQAGSTSASPALVASAVLAAAAALIALAAPWIVRCLSAWVREGLLGAARPEAAAEFARSLALRGGLLTAAVGLLVLGVALVAQSAQFGRRATGAPATPASREGPTLPRIDTWRGARSVLMVALAAVVVSAALRGVLMGIGDAFDPREPARTFAALAHSVGWPLLVMLMAVAVLDAIAERTGWMRGAWMTRREVEEEMRDTEGHPLTRERRDVAGRRRRDA
jgi:flagellar biosynthesis protein FlhB